MLVQNQVSFTITDEESKEVDAAIAKLNEILLPKMVQLKSEDHQQLLKVGDSTITFMAKGFEILDKYPEYAPGFFNREEAEIDFKAVTILRGIFKQLEPLTSLVNDTMSLSASEAYAALLAVYNTIKLAAKNRQPGAQLAYDDLKSHFPKTTPPKGPENPAA
jgi:hypothetical protein